MYQRLLDWNFSQEWSRSTGELGQCQPWKMPFKSQADISMSHLPVSAMHHVLVRRGFPTSSSGHTFWFWDFLTLEDTFVVKEHRTNNSTCTSETACGRRAREGTVLGWGALGHSSVHSGRLCRCLLPLRKNQKNNDQTQFQELSFVIWPRAELLVCVIYLVHQNMTCLEWMSKILQLCIRIGTDWCWGCPGTCVTVMQTVLGELSCLCFGLLL